MRDDLVQKFRERKSNIPRPGEGNNTHNDLLGVANIGVIAGLPPEQIIEEIYNAIPTGPRKVGKKEVTDTVRRAVRDYSGKDTPIKYNKPQPQFDGLVARSNYIKKAVIRTEVDTWEYSPKRLTWEPPEDPIHFLTNNYEPDDRIFIGNEFDSGKDNIQTRDKWINDFKEGREVPSHIIPNPLTGDLAPKKSSEGESYRGDNNVIKFKYCMAEFDDIPLDDQLAFWSVIKLPIKCLVFSGGKSVHVWFDITKMTKVENADDWDRNIVKRLYENLLIPMRVDRACSNISRLARMPGHYREEKQNWQKILWMS